MAKKRKQSRKSSRTATRSAGPARRSSTSTASRPASPELLSWALQGLQQEIDATRTRLAQLEAHARVLGSKPSARTVPAAAGQSAVAAADEAEAPARGRAARRRKRKLSPEARTRIADAQKRRWEAYRESKKKK